jgi:hypothetical protein
MKDHIFEVVVNCETPKQAKDVITERIGHDECLGFNYSIRLNEENTALTKSFQTINKMWDVLEWLIAEYESGELSNAPDGLINMAKKVLDDVVNENLQ